MHDLQRIQVNMIYKKFMYSIINMISADNEIVQFSIRVSNLMENCTISIAALVVKKDCGYYE